MPSQSLLRYSSWTVWFVAIPGAFAWFVVGWCTGAPDRLGELGDWVREQRVPSAIVLFTVMEMTLYYFRHYLPFAEHMSGGGPAGLSREERRDFEAAHHLLEEAHRILKRYAESVEKQIPNPERRELDTVLDSLKAAMDAERFDVEPFRNAYDRASDLVDQHLAPWRKSEAREYVESIGVAIIIALLLRALVVEAFKIPSGSMLPTLQIDDHIFVNKFVYGPLVPFTHTRLFDQLPPRRGDVIVFEFPDVPPGQTGQDFIKRVIAVPGDTLEVVEGHPLINGWEVPKCFVGMYTYGAKDGTLSERGELYVEFLEDQSYLTVFEEHSSAFHDRHQGPYHVQSGEVWVMGDARHNSHDSRAWHGGKGAGVPFENIEGRAMFVWLPPARLLVPVMGRPELPHRLDAELQANLDKCLAERPTNTTPPTPSPRTASGRPGRRP